MGKQEAGQGHGADGDDQCPPSETPQRHDKQREQHVILLLNGKAPGVQQRLFFRCGREIAAALVPEKEIGGEQADGDDAAGKACHLLRQHPRPGEWQAA
ncbi:hypothetical protein D3C87_1664090 [compost metagenome]